MPYPALVGLLNDASFAEFVTKAFKKFEQDEIDSSQDLPESLKISPEPVKETVEEEEEEEEINQRKRNRRSRVLSDHDDDDNDKFNDSGACLLTSSELDELDREAATACIAGKTGIYYFLKFNN